MGVRVTAPGGQTRELSVRGTVLFLCCFPAAGRACASRFACIAWWEFMDDVLGPIKQSLHRQWRLHA